MGIMDAVGDLLGVPRTGLQTLRLIAPSGKAYQGPGLSQKDNVHARKAAGLPTTAKKAPGSIGDKKGKATKAAKNVGYGYATYKKKKSEDKIRTKGGVRPKSGKKSTAAKDFLDAQDSLLDSLSFGLHDPYMEMTGNPEVTYIRDFNPVAAAVGDGLAWTYPYIGISAAGRAGGSAYKSLKAGKSAKQVGSGTKKTTDGFRTWSEKATRDKTQHGLNKGLREAQNVELDELLSIPVGHRSIDEMRRIDHLLGLKQGKKPSVPKKSGSRKAEHPRKPKPKVVSLAEYKKSKP